MFQLPDAPLDDSLRDGVDSLADSAAEPPTIVSISDIHGYLDAARSALLTLADHPAFPPVVTAGDDGRLHWAGENYVLVFNGDLVDRGPANEEVLALVGRLMGEAPPGRVRLTLGNHEALALSPDQFGFDEWYSGQLDDVARRRFCEAIVDGHVVAAYEGHAVTYAHAGADDPYDATAVNESLVAAAVDLREAIGTAADRSTQGRIVTDYSQVLGVGRNHLKGPEAGLVWLHFDHLTADAPPQVVGHTRHVEPQTSGRVHCQNVLRETVDISGGEAVFVETLAGVSALVRRPDGGVEHREPPF